MGTQSPETVNTLPFSPAEISSEPVQFRPTKISLFGTEIPHMTSQDVQNIKAAFALKAEADALKADWKAKDAEAAAAIRAVEPLFDAALSPGDKIPITGTPYAVTKDESGALVFGRINKPRTLEDLIK